MTVAAAGAIRAALTTTPEGVDRREITISAGPDLTDVRIRIADVVPGDRRTSEYAVDRFALQTSHTLGDVLRAAVANHNAAVVS